MEYELTRDIHKNNAEMEGFAGQGVIEIHGDIVAVYIGNPALQAVRGFHDAAQADLEGYVFLMDSGDEVLLYGTVCLFQRDGKIALLSDFHANDPAVKAVDQLAAAHDEFERRITRPDGQTSFYSHFTDIGIEHAAIIKHAHIIDGNMVAGLDMQGFIRDGHWRRRSLNGLGAAQEEDEQHAC